MARKRTAWAIRLGTTARPQPFFLRAAGDGHHAWTSAAPRALSFDSAAAALAAARRLIGGVFHASEIDLFPRIAEHVETSAAVRAAAARRFADGWEAERGRVRLASSFDVAAA